MNPKPFSVAQRQRLGLCIFAFVFGFQCKPSVESEFDRLKKKESIFVMVVFCEKNKSTLQNRQTECSDFESQAESEINATLSRWQDLGFTKLILPKAKGEEMQMAIRAKTEWAIRYFDIWKSRVILE